MGPNDYEDIVYYPDGGRAEDEPQDYPEIGDQDY